MNRYLSLSLLLTLLTLFYSLSAQNSMNVIAQFQGEHHASGYGTTIVSLDFNHDGYTDLVVLSASYGYQYNTSPSRGKVYIYYGGPNFGSSTPASVTLEGSFNGTSGRKIGNIYNFGDVNGDGFDDLCIMDFTPQHEGDIRLLFYYYPTTNLNNSDYVLTFPDGTESLCLRKTGDVNGDGVDDIGAAYRLPGTLQSTFSIFIGGNFFEHIVTTYPIYLSLEFILIGIGDINNDGFADFTVGYTNEDPNTGYHLIKLYYGNAALDFTNSTTLIQTQEPITVTSIPLGDMNGDGYADFLGYVSNQGMQSWLGGENLDFTTPDISFHPIWYGTDGGKQTAYGDVNNDGFDDMVSTSYNGRMLGLWLGKQHPNGIVDWTTHVNSDNFGMGLSMGDYNADGFCDIAVSAPFQNDPPAQGSFYGFLWVYGGNANLADTTATEDNVLTIADDNLNISLYPNPLRANQLLNIEVTNLKDKSPMTTDVFNIKGQCLYHKISSGGRKDNQNITVNVSDLSYGLYLCRITQGTKQTVKKFNLIK